MAILSVDFVPKQRPSGEILASVMIDFCKICYFQKQTKNSYLWKTFFTWLYPLKALVLVGRLMSSTIGQLWDITTSLFCTVNIGRDPSNPIEQVWKGSGKLDYLRKKYSVLL